MLTLKRWLLTAALLALPVFAVMADRYEARIVYQGASGSVWTGLAMGYDRQSPLDVPEWHWSATDDTVTIWDDLGDAAVFGYPTNNTDSSQPVYTGVLVRIEPPTIGGLLVTTNL